MKGQKNPAYSFTLTALDGEELFSYGGSLRHGLSIMAESSDCGDIVADNYHKIYRELRRTGGAYSSYYPTSGAPLLLTIVDCALLPARCSEAAPLSGGAIAEQNDRISREVIWQNPETLSSFAVTPIAVLEPTPLEILIENEKKAIEVPLTFQEMSSAQQWQYVQTGKPQLGPKSNIHPKECTCTDCTPKHNHPTLSWSQMSAWQRKQYRVK